MSNTPISDLALEADFPDFITTLSARLRTNGDPLWPEYVLELAQKLHRSKGVYGDSSFSLEPLQYVIETIAEAVDISGWPFLMFSTRPELRDVALEIAADGFRLYCRLRAFEKIIKGDNHDAHN